ncbi:hypothetical protein AYI69_g7780 [Smittium culicis]|uniref:Uncharacterized protein n=1 Tax=Smittium culicis TaxID=133412 RepID=A0A1R1XPN2_9FUNG|nr:hypothetical protein AYI69_g7780 [Smittium culicis]
MKSIILFLNNSKSCSINTKGFALFRFARLSSSFLEASTACFLFESMNFLARWKLMSGVLTYLSPALPLPTQHLNITTNNLMASSSAGLHLEGIYRSSQL